MKGTKRILLAGTAAAALVLSTGFVASAAENDSTFRVYWKEGLRLDSADGEFKLKIGGRIQNDWAFFDSSGDLESAIGSDIDDGTEFRRARLYVAGEIYRRVIFKAQYDFAGGDADFKDVYIGIKDVPVLGTIKAGHFFEPFSLEQNTSSKYITFLERSLPIALAFDRNTGIMASNAVLDERMTWAAGVFRDSDSFGDSTGDEYNFTARVTGLPFAAGDDQLVHLGAAYRRSSPVDDTLRLRARPEAHLAPRFTDTGSFGAEDFDALGFEAATVLGPVSLQGEFIEWFVDGDGGADPDFRGWYVFGSYFLTGESRRYDRKHGVFSRVKPNENFLQGDGCGAWEVAFRYSDLDTSDAGLLGGEMDAITIALNWYLNPNTRVMTNYVHTTLDDRSGLSGEENVNMFLTRFQVDF